MCGLLQAYMAKSSAVTLSIAAPFIQTRISVVTVILLSLPLSPDWHKTYLSMALAPVDSLVGSPPNRRPIYIIRRVYSYYQRLGPGGWVWYLTSPRKIGELSVSMYARSGKRFVPEAYFR